jgi:AcrR family transcriptional regulator
MEDIASLVGIRPSSLYNHVDSKQELLANIMVTTMRKLLDRFESAVKTECSAVQLRRAMEAHVRYHATHRRDVRIGRREIPSLEEPTQSLVRQLRRDYAHGWRSMIETGVSRGEFRTFSSQLAAYALLEMGIGVSSWYREDGPLSLDQIVYHYGNMALRQLGVPEENFEISEQP